MTMSMPGFRPQLWCAACGYVFPFLVLLALFGSGVLPPPSPNAPAAETAAWYQGDSTVKMLGFAGAAVGLGLVGPLTIAITMQMLRIEGRWPTMSFLNLAAGLFTWVITIVPMIILCVAAFRPERDVEVTQAIHDLGYIMFFMGFAPFAAQDVAIAVAVLRDKAADRVYPRWVAWFNLWVGFIFLPAAVIPFFKVGPFTYRGLLAFWLPTMIYGLWAIVMAHMTRKAIHAEAAGEDAMGSQVIEEADVRPLAGVR